MNVSRNLIAALLLLNLAAGFVGCAGKDVDRNDPASLLADAEEEIKNDHYQMAIDKLKTIKNRFPYSKYSVEAQLRIADVYFMEESFAEAASAYESFRDLHPKHEKTPYAMFRIAQSYYNDMPSTVARDQTSCQRALDAYNEFLHRYPNSPDAPQAKRDIENLRKALAEKELYIADFYYKRSRYDSARPRYRKIIDVYPDTEAAKEAEKKIAAMSAKTKKED